MAKPRESAGQPPRPQPNPERMPSDMNRASMAMCVLLFGSLMYTLAAGTVQPVLNLLTYLKY